MIIFNKTDAFITFPEQLKLEIVAGTYSSICPKQVQSRESCLAQVCELNVMRLNEINVGDLQQASFSSAQQVKGYTCCRQEIFVQMHACLQPSQAIVDALCDGLGAKVKCVHAIPANLSGDNDLFSRKILQCSAKHLSASKLIIGLPEWATLRNLHSTSTLMKRMIPTTPFLIVCSHSTARCQRRLCLA